MCVMIECESVADIFDISLEASVRAKALDNILLYETNMNWLLPRLGQDDSNLKNVLICNTCSLTNTMYKIIKTT